MPRKIIFIGPAYPYRGGIAAFNENLATRFQNNGWECKIFTFSQQYPNMLFPGKTQLTTEDPKPNLTIQRGIYSMNPLNWIKISKQIVSEMPELVITQYWMPFMAPAFGTILRGIKKELPSVKIITIVHNFKPHESRIGDKQLNKYISNRTDLLVCLSDSVLKEITSTIRSKPVVQLFHPIYDHYGEKLDQDLAKEKMGWSPTTKYLVFFGLVRAYKGLDVLLEGLSYISDKHDYKLVIAGEFYQDEEKYRKQITDLGLEEKVIIRNEYIPNEEIPSLFCSASCIVLPYRTATQSGVVPIALHFENHVIVTRVGSLSSIIEKHQLGIVTDPNPKALGSAIEKFLNNEILLKSDFNSIKNDLSWQTFYTHLLDKTDLHEL